MPTSAPSSAKPKHLNAARACDNGPRAFGAVGRGRATVFPVGSLVRPRVLGAASDRAPSSSAERREYGNDLSWDDVCGLIVMVSDEGSREDDEGVLMEAGGERPATTDGELEGATTPNGI